MYIKYDKAINLDEVVDMFAQIPSLPNCIHDDSKLKTY